MIRPLLRQSVAALTVVALTLGPVSPSSGQTVPRRAAPTPTLLSNCDITVQSCGGDPVFGGGSGPPSGGSAQCGNGSKGECNRTTHTVCTEWHVIDGSVEFTVSDLGGLTIGAGGRLTCQTWKTTIQYYYWI